MKYKEIYKVIRKSDSIVDDRSTWRKVNKTLQDTWAPLRIILQNKNANVRLWLVHEKGVFNITTAQLDLDVKSKEYHDSIKHYQLKRQSDVVQNLREILGLPDSDVEECPTEQDTYHKKFERLYKSRFTGRAFNSAEFLHHLTNINFHFEVGELSKLSPEALHKIKNLFSFYQYGGSVKGLDMESDAYYQGFRDLVDKYGRKYGFIEPLGWTKGGKNDGLG